MFRAYHEKRLSADTHDRGPAPSPARPRRGRLRFRIRCRPCRSIIHGLRRARVRRPRRRHDPGHGRHQRLPSPPRAPPAAARSALSRPARYLSFSIRLRSRVALYLDAGSVIVRGRPAPGPGPLRRGRSRTRTTRYQDFGHSHWHNSLIWGDDLDDVAILGPGRIWGRGLTRSGPGANRPLKASGDMPSSLGAKDPDVGERTRAPGRRVGAGMDGKGNKAIALKKLPQRAAGRYFSMLIMRSFRRCCDRRRQPDDRRTHRRHGARRLRHRLLQERAHQRLRR